MSELQKQLQELSDDFQKIQSGDPGVSRARGRTRLTAFAELQSTVEVRQKLESQQQENKGVQEVCSITLCFDP